MSLQPFCREDMRALKSAKDGTIKNMKINYIVKKIYGEAIRFAETNKGTVYTFALSPANEYSHSLGHITIPSNVKSNLLPDLTSPILFEDVINCLDDILINLTCLFPECLVEHRKVTNAKGSTDAYIAIDWS